MRSEFARLRRDMRKMIDDTQRMIVNNDTDAKYSEPGSAGPMGPAGPAGAAGPQGEQGPQGDSGSGFNAPTAFEDIGISTQIPLPADKNMFMLFVYISADWSNGYGECEVFAIFGKPDTALNITRITGSMGGYTNYYQAEVSSGADCIDVNVQAVESPPENTATYKCVLLEVG
jgi:hypothetical protein